MTQISLKTTTIKTIVAVSLLTVLLCMPGVLYYTKQKDSIDLLYAIIVPLVIFLIPILVFHKLLRWYIFLIAIFILLAPITTFPIFYFGVPVRKDMLLITLNTSYQEAHELLKGYLSIFLVIYAIYITLTIIAIKWIPPKISLKSAILISVTSLFSLFGITIARYSISNINQGLRNLTFTYYPFHFMYVCYNFYKEEIQTRNAEINIQHLFYKDVKNDSVSSRQIYVLIIGESARYYNWEINGYSRATSPLLMKQKNLLTYRNVAASGGLTELAVPQIITGVSARNYSDHLHKAGIIRLFHQAGFKTYWISNQTDEGNIRMHASIADSTIWMQNVIGSDKHIHYDMELVNSMKCIIEKGENNCLFVLHTLGSHYRYTLRYPGAFSLFKPVGNEDSAVPTDESNKPRLINAYDNSIFYTDAVIDSAIQILKHYNYISALIYSSDHGENLFDDSRNLVLHAPISPTKYLAHIPFFIYCSQKYIQQFPSKWETLNKHDSDKISNNQIFETLVNLAGIKYKGQNLSNSIASNKFKDSPQEILGPSDKVFLYSKLK